MLVDLLEAGPRLGWRRPAERLAEATEAPVFLGFSGEAPCFAADVSGLDEEAARTRFGEGA